MTRPVSAAIILALASAGCAAIPQRAAWVEMRPLQVGGERETSPVDRYYAGAAAAIERRDYAAALDLLQLARAHAPADVRVLNAFGVIYDKLGRFDLSARYYAQAAALEPSSPIVAANVAYSAVLEQRIARPVEGAQLAQAGNVRRMAQPNLSPAAAATGQIVETARPASPTPIAAAPGGLAPLPLQAGAPRNASNATPPPAALPSRRVVSLASAPAPRSLPLLTGRTLLVINASGLPSGGEQVVTRLAGLGWSVPRSARTGSPERQTTIVYPTRNAAVARALARTLPYKARLVNCADRCDRMRLVVGADVLAWRRGLRTGPVMKARSA